MPADAVYNFKDIDIHNVGTGFSFQTIGTVVQREPAVAPKVHYCYATADTTDMKNISSLYLWIHADRPEPPGSRYINPWGSP
jgi:hypothetical protein